MNRKIFLRGACALALAFTVPLGSTAAEVQPRPFGTGTLQRMAAQHKGTLLVRFWSIECEYCIKEMGMLRQLAARHPDWQLVLVSTDGASQSKVAAAVLRREGLDPGASWIFAEHDIPRLRFDVDPKWHGELPRTYIYVAGKQVAAFSGASGVVDIERRLASAGGRP